VNRDNSFTNPNPNLVQMRRITRRFPGIVANDSIDFDLGRGEIHALLGENGAGKSTLMSILCGLYRPDRGEIQVDGQVCRFSSPGDAIKVGIGMVHQHFMLVNTHTVLENIALGLAGQGFLLREKALEKKINTLSEHFGLKVDPAARIWQISVGEQQRVEILKTLIRGARILILDEPTAVLTDQEAESLFLTLEQFRQRGHSTIFISHKLDEVMRIADRITILRKGRVAGCVNRAATSERELARMMVGREVLFDYPPRTPAGGDPILVLEKLEVANDQGLPAVRKLSLNLCRGEILGLAGVAGNGQNELAGFLYGMRKAQGGRMLFDGADVTGRGPRELRNRGVRYIPADRLGEGLVPALDFNDNLILGDYRQPACSSGPLLRNREINRWAQRVIGRFQIQLADPRNPVRLLSGGNLQKLLLGRELEGEPRLVIASSPTRGLDVGAAEAVRKMLLAERERKAAILLISEDLDEILQISDRIAVIYEGRIMDIIPAEKAERERIGLLMGGKPPA